MNTNLNHEEIDTMLMLMHHSPESPAPHVAASFEPPQILFSAANTHNNTMPFSSSFTHFPSTTISFTNKLHHPNPFTTPVDLLQENDRHKNMLLDSSEKRSSSMAAMREMIFRTAAMQPVVIDSESVKPPKRRNVKISKDPQSVAARLRRGRVSERIRILQRMVPGGTKMDTASMLDEAIHYLKFLKKQVQSLQRLTATNSSSRVVGFPSYLPATPKGYETQGVDYFRDAC